MMRNMLKSKIHRATVTDADLNYDGSITVDVASRDREGRGVFDRIAVVNRGEPALRLTRAVRAGVRAGSLAYRRSRG